MKKVKKKIMTYAKTIFCITLSAAMILAEAPMTTLAKEALIAKEALPAEESTESEIMTEESGENTKTQDEIPTEDGVKEEGNEAGETEDGTEENGAEQGGKTDAEVEESVLTERKSDENDTTKGQTDDEEVSTEEDLTDKTETEELSTDVPETETEIEESTQELLFSDSDIAHGEYKENGNDITWVIDADGKLTVEGTGDFASASSSNRAPWYEKRTDIQSAEIKVTGMKNAGYMFYGCSSLTSVDVSGFDTSSVTNMVGMFSGCSSLTSVDVSGFDTGSVTSMGNMFYGCSSLTSVDMSGFDTGSVTSMSSMFSGCSKLTSVDVSGFNTSSVTYMGWMFYRCSSLTSVDVSGFDTGNVTSMSSMFAECSSLTSVDVSDGFDTGCVTSMHTMFSDCNRLTSVDVSGFDTSSVTDMAGMFQNCSSLTSVDVSGFDTSHVTSMHTMFSDCNRLTSVDVSGFDTSSVTDMAGIFQNCRSLTSVDVSGFDTSHVTDMGWMFLDCRSLTSLDVSGFDTGNVASMFEMFEDCSNLTSLDVSGFDTSSVTDTTQMFYGCSSLMSLDVSGFDTSSMTTMKNMFSGCSSLTSLDVSGFDTSGVTGMGGMFDGCSSLMSLDVSGFDTSSVTTMGSMFNGCSKLTSLDVSGFDTGSVTQMSAMFEGCSGLTSIDLSSFDTSSVTAMSAMFGGCSGLTSIDLSSFDTSLVTGMVKMFEGCSGLTSIDLSSFDTSSVTAMGDLFLNCSNLNTIYTPRNVKVNYEFYIDESRCNFYDMSGKSYTALPKDQPESILLYRTDKPAAHITARKAKTVYACGETPDADGIKEDITVTYYSAAGTVKELAPEDYSTNVSQIDMGTAGEKTLTVTYSPSEGEPMTADIMLTVGYLLEEDSVTITLADADNCVFDKKAKKPTPAVTYKAGETPVLLEKDKDYTVLYKNNKNAYQNSADAENTAVSADDAPTVIIKGCGAYFGTVKTTFEIAKAAAPAGQELVREINESTQSGNITQDQIAGCFSKYGSITGYEVGTPAEDNVVSGNVLAGEPSKVQSGSSYNISLSYSADKKAGDFVTVPVTVSFRNYEDAILNIRIVVEGTPATAKKEAAISGIEIKDSVYNKLPVSYMGTAKVVSEENNTDLTSTVNLTYTYSGTQADGSAYAATTTAPTNAGSYKLTVAVASDNADYTGSAEYPFTIAKAPLTITARDMELKIGAPLPQTTDYQYDTAGLLEGDSLTTEPTFTCNIANTDAAGTYDITVSGADAGMNYEITYQKGTLTVSEEGESANYYTVTFSLSGHGSDITNTGVKEGSLLEKPQNPQADGYTFTGWYKDQGCTVLWDFDKDTVQSDTTIYAGWTKNGTTGGDDEEDSPYADSERTDLSSVNGAIANIKAKVYDQNAYEPVIKVTVKEGKKTVTLTEGADYRVIYQNNTNAGEGKVIVKGNGIYKGQIEKTFTISPKPVKKLKVLTSGIVGTATKQVASGAVYVYDGTKRLVEDVDYELSDVQPVKNKTDVVQVTVKGKKPGNYDGEVITKITVYESGTDLSKLITPDNVTLVPESSAKAVQDGYAYIGKAIKPAVTVTIGGVALTNKDYKVQYQNNKDAGTAYAVVTGKGEYKGKTVIPFTIKAETVANQNDFTIKAIKDMTYNGRLQKPAVKVTIQKNGKAKNLSKKDYAVTYKNNLHAGTATVTVTGKGNYAGLGATTTFKINPQQIKKASLKGTKGSLTLIYNKWNLKEGTDYETPVYGTENKNKVEVTIKGKGDFTGEIKKNIKTN